MALVYQNVLTLFDPCTSTGCRNGGHRPKPRDT